MARDTKTEGIDFNPDGTIDITIDGVVRHLRRPKLREFRHWSGQLRELAKAAQADQVQLQEMLEAITAEDTDEAELERLQKEMEAAQQTRMEYTTPWIAGVVEQFSEKPLPEEADDWPSWLALDLSTPGKILNHWKRVPLAPGAAGTN